MRPDRNAASPHGGVAWLHCAQRAQCPQGLEFLTMTTAIALTYFAGFVGFVTTMAAIYGRKARPDLSA